MEQRQLYFEQQESLTSRLKTLSKELDKKSRGRVRCEKVYPFLSVQIGKLVEEITEEQDDCDIHMVENRLLLK